MLSILVGSQYWIYDLIGSFLFQRTRSEVVSTDFLLNIWPHILIHRKIWRIWQDIGIEGNEVYEAKKGGVYPKIKNLVIMESEERGTSKADLKKGAGKWGILDMKSIPSLKQTAKVPKNLWLEDDSISSWVPLPIFSGELLVSGSVPPLFFTENPGLAMWKESNKLGIQPFGNRTNFFVLNDIVMSSFSGRNSQHHSFWNFCTSKTSNILTSIPGFDMAFHTSTSPNLVLGWIQSDFVHR